MQAEVQSCKDVICEKDPEMPPYFLGHISFKMEAKWKTGETN